MNGYCEYTHNTLTCMWLEVKLTGIIFIHTQYCKLSKFVCSLVCMVELAATISKLKKIYETLCKTFTDWDML